MAHSPASSSVHAFSPRLTTFLHWPTHPTLPAASAVHVLGAVVESGGRHRPRLAHERRATAAAVMAAAATAVPGIATRADVVDVKYSAGNLVLCGSRRSASAAITQPSVPFCQACTLLTQCEVTSSSMSNPASPLLPSPLPSRTESPLDRRRVWRQLLQQVGSGAAAGGVRGSCCSSAQGSAGQAAVVVQWPCCAA